MSALFSAGYMPPNLVPLAKQTGVKQVLTECQKQHADAVCTLQNTNTITNDLIASIQRTRSTLLLGMGASHFVNQIIAGQLRSLGIECFAIPLSEQIAAPFSTQNKTVIIVSQSGDSIEVSHYLDNTQNRTEHFGLSLSKESFLANSIPTLIAHGGREVGFAATRSFLLTLTLYSTVLDGLNTQNDRKQHSLSHEPTVHEQLDMVLPTQTISSLFFAGRGITEGLANMAALGCMELGQLPCLGFELGQFRHGPVEALSPRTMVVILDAGGISNAILENINAICEEAGSPLLWIGNSPLATTPIPTKKCLTLPTQTSDMQSLLAMIPTVQALILTLSAQHNTNIGAPRFCTKVTDIA